MKIIKKYIFVSQRSFISKKDKEMRDCIDRRWSNFLNKCNLLPIFVPNNTKILNKYLVSLPIDGILLTGGGDLSPQGGTDFEREKIENNLIKYSIKKKLPLLGVCRGMQAIQNYYGDKLYKVKNHVVKKQKIFFSNGKIYEFPSFHNFGTVENNKNFQINARSHDNIIKSISHKKLPLHGIMWHPERIIKFNEINIKFFKEIFF